MKTYTRRKLMTTTAAAAVAAPLAALLPSSAQASPATAPALVEQPTSAPDAPSVAVKPPVNWADVKATIAEQNALIADMLTHHADIEAMALIGRYAQPPAMSSAWMSVEAQVLDKLPDSELGQLVARIVCYTAWLYTDAFGDAAVALAGMDATERGWKSGHDGVNQYSNGADCVRALQLSRPVGEVLYDLFSRDLMMRPSRYVRQAVPAGYRSFDVDDDDEPGVQVA